MASCLRDHESVVMLGHLMFVEHGADGDAAPGRAAERAAFVRQPGGDGGELADGGRAQGGDPVQTGGFDIGFEPGVGDHAAIAD